MINPTFLVTTEYSVSNNVLYYLYPTTKIYSQISKNISLLNLATNLIRNDFVTPDKRYVITHANENFILVNIRFRCSYE